MPSKPTTFLNKLDRLEINYPYPEVTIDMTDEQVCMEFYNEDKKLSILLENGESKLTLIKSDSKMYKESLTNVSDEELRWTFSWLNG